MKNFKCKTFLGTIILISTTIVSGCNSSNLVKEINAPSISVKLKTLTAANLEESSQFVGQLEATEKVIIKPEIEGRIKQIRLISGNRIQRGEILMLLEPDRTQSQLASAKAALKVAMANRNTIIEQLNVSRAQKESAEAEVNLARVNYKRAEFLLNSGVIGKFQYDRAETDYKTKLNRLEEAENLIQASVASVQQADANVEQAQAQVATAAVDRGFKQIVSPLSGVLGDISLNQGDYVNRGETIATITRNDFLDLRISVPASRSEQLQIGMNVELFDPIAQKSLSMGQIYFISPNVETSLQTILIKARFPNLRNNLRDGQQVEAKIVWNQKPGILIPTTAISRIGSKNFVFVVEEQELIDNKIQQIVRQRPIELGKIQGNNYQVIEGLQVGDNIAVSNILKLRDGAIIESE